MYKTALLAALLAVPAVIPAPAAAAGATGGTLKILSYNIAGLPDILSSADTDRATSTTAIGSRIAGYDLVNVQEDFNFHAYLYAADTHAYRTPTSGGAGIGSGLNTLSKYAYDTDDFERDRWTSCQYDSGDCLTPKGFTFQRVRLAEGVYVDVYNLHANAGTNAGDLASRAANLSQLTTFIGSHSPGNAVLVFGDTNTRYTRDGDTIADFVANNGLTDAWVTLERGGVAPAKGADPILCSDDSCEVVDKVLYRGSRFITLNATAYHNEHAAFLDAGGLMLSDHDPVSVNLNWSTNPAYQFSEQFGGPHGDYFDDVDTAGPLSSISLRAGSRVDRIGPHGGTGGTLKTLTLGDGEYVTSAQLCRGVYNSHTRIFSAKFTTNRGNTLAGGTTTADCVTRTAPTGWQIAGFHGRAGDEVDKLGLIYTRH
ncbi:Sphingomyelin phosphodiesterase 2 [Actinoplanes sp. SE50]|uniref:jacalin-like lectin n=1 Tax=unclassified Actinoplanes TaxID=2626549 RepID=UPI00023EC30C|nr:MULTISPECIES: jacalin-like lectin [unclassified Actinoplanes]AEV86358.1 Sphingomyelin phosphodiesterase 2 [Actinoplanes sp. SE50/110]ATO84755.1 Sphingomyelin phosphodiesterase 2 [Actinoplanes sp. SE50]SLM02165.1 Sphingomyelin phosphodiesterase 2 [Actinoplanes sp. SE50/110]